MTASAPATTPSPTTPAPAPGADEVRGTGVLIGDGDGALWILPIAGAATVEGQAVVISVDRARHAVHSDLVATLAFAPGATAELEQDGSVLVHDATGAAVAAVSAPRGSADTVRASLEADVVTWRASGPAPSGTAVADGTSVEVPEVPGVEAVVTVTAEAVSTTGGAALSA